MDRLDQVGHLALVAREDLVAPVVQKDQVDQVDLRDQPALKEPSPSAQVDLVDQEDLQDPADHLDLELKEDPVDPVDLEDQVH